MALKPLFYLLAQHGPWSHHVRVKDTTTLGEALLWLDQQGKVQDKDYEVLVEHIEHRQTKTVMMPGQLSGKTTMSLQPRVSKSVEPIIFINDSSLATYIKMTWGGQ